MSLAHYLGGISFNLLAPDAKPDDHGRFHLSRPDGSIVTLLDRGALALEIGNTRLPPLAQQRGEDWYRLTELPKMSTYTIGGILNAAVAGLGDDSAFVNVGVWHGFTFFAGLCGNEGVRAIGIDDFSEFPFGDPRSEFEKRFRRLASERHRFVEEDYRNVFREGLSEPIGVYLYDGNHSYENQLEGLRLAEPFFSDDCLIMVDDANWKAPRKATFDFMAESSRSYSVLLDVRTAGNHPTLWNGLLIVRAGASEGTSDPHCIPAPEITSAPPVGPLAGEAVSVLLGVGEDAAVTEATASSVAAQTHSEVELLTFGPEAGSCAGVEHRRSAPEALAASGGAYVALVESGRDLPPAAVANAVAEAT